MEPKKRNSHRYFPAIGAVVGGILFLLLVFRVISGGGALGSADVPRQHADGKVHIHDMNGLTSTANAENNKENVLILTPMARFYPDYWENLEKLSYPHELIDLGFIVPNNVQGDAVLKLLEAKVDAVQKSKKKFHRVTVLRQDTPAPDSQDEASRHAMDAQKERRRLMSLARNSLLFTTIQYDTSWILWLDSDVVETPATLIQDMTSHNKDVLVANCYQRYTENGESLKRPYDYNSWVDSPVAQELGASMGKDDILLEGYKEMATYRTLMSAMYSEDGDVREEMELDGVGGTALLVRSDVHRDGAMFPPFAFYHLIETEGFAKMAKRLGYNVYGLPNYLVYHYNE